MSPNAETPLGVNREGPQTKTNAPAGTLGTSLTSAPVTRLVPNPDTPGAFLITVACPFCELNHTHGWEPNGETTSPRVSHCSPANGSANRLARQRDRAADERAILDTLIEGHDEGRISAEQLERRIQHPVRRLTEARTRIAKLERQSTRQDYTITGLPAGPTTPAGATK